MTPEGGVTMPDRPTHREAQRTARIAGIWFVITWS
jgi:hypothetical protein